MPHPTPRRARRPRRQRSEPDPRLVFLTSFLRRPREVGSIIPSSRFLERRVVRAAAVPRARRIVELGPGTGGTTRAVLRAMADDAKLLAIEINPRLARLVREENPDPRLLVREGSATDLPQILEETGFGAPDLVLSGIPFSTLPREVALDVLRGIRDSLAPGGHFVAYQVRDRVAVLGRQVFGPPQTRTLELRNVPPMRIYRFEKPAEADRAASAH